MKCSRCKTDKPETEFHRNRTMCRGRDSNCKKCNAELAAVYRRTKRPHNKRCRYSSPTRCWRMSKFDGGYCLRHRGGRDMGGDHLMALAWAVVNEHGRGTPEEVSTALAAAWVRMKNPKPMRNVLGCIGACMRFALRREPWQAKRRRVTLQFVEDVSVYEEAS